MKKIKIILIFVILLFILFALGFYYLNTYYLPQIIKTKITQEASKKLGVAVGIEDIKLNLFKGIVFHNLNFANKKDSAPILQIRSISATFLILPFLKQKKIILPSINIDNSELNIIRYENNKLNIQDFIPNQANKEISTIPILIHKININNSKISFIDETTQPNFKQTLELDNIEAQISLSGINFELKGALINKKQTSNLGLSGDFKFKTRKLKISFQTEKIDALSYLVYLKNLPVTIKSFFLNKINTECGVEKDILSIKTNADICDTTLIMNKILVSNITTKLIASFNINLKNKSDFDYRINIDGLNANLTNPQIPEKTKIEYAKLEIVPDGLDIKNAKIRLLQIPVALKGNLQNFSNPVFNINLLSNTELSRVKDLLKNYFDFDDSIIAEGKTDIDINLAKLKDSKDVGINGSLNLKNVSLKTKNIPYEITKINGLINFDKENANWANLTFSLFEESFKSQATISNFNSPLISLELNSDKIDISSKISSLQKNIFKIDLLKGRYYNSQFMVNGDLDIRDKNSCYVDLDIQSQIELEDLTQIKYLSGENISMIKPEGKCEISARVIGDIKNPKFLNALFDLSSNEIKLYGLKFQNLVMQLAQENQQIKIPRSVCKFYGGSVSMNGLVDLEEKNNPYALKIIFTDVDLSKLKQDTPIKDKTFKGSLAATVILNGELTSLQELKSKGEFLIKDGFLWEFNPLKKLGDFLFIPKHEALIFKEAIGAFDIYDKKVFTDNLILSSDVIMLTCTGNMDFAGNLDFEITPKPPVVQTIEEAAQDLGEYERFFGGIFSEAGGIFIIKLTGTIKEPKFEKKIIVMDVLDKVKDEFVDKIKTVTDLIFGGSK